MVGLKRGTVTLLAHDPEWEMVAEQTIIQLKNLLGDVACDIRHVGSTSIPTIKAKPIIDIAIGVKQLEDIRPFIPIMKEHGFHQKDVGHVHQVFFSAGDFEKDIRTHHIHVVQYNGMEWLNYLNFTAYLNAHPTVAHQYEQLKESLVSRFSNDRVAYTDGKADFIRHTLRKAMVWSYLGKTVEIGIDRPIGYAHKKDIVYPINYGYIPGVLGGDEEELDVYLLGVNEPVSSYRAKIVAIVHRENDVEDKLVALPEHMTMSQYEIAEAVHFQEKYYDSHIEALCDSYTIREILHPNEKELFDLGFIRCEECDFSYPQAFSVKPPNACLTLAAYQNDRLLGLIRAFANGNSTILLRNLFVLPTARQKGIGSRLLSEVIGRYRTTHEIYANVNPQSNLSEFYLKHGFQKTSQSDLLQIDKFEYPVLPKPNMIRAMLEDDIPHCVTLLRSSILKAAEELGSTNEQASHLAAKAISEEDLRKKHRAGRPLFVYVDANHTLLGFYSLHIEDTQVVALENLCIAPEHRHKKHGEKLLLHAIREGMIRGKRHMTTVIWGGNSRLQEWYEKYGFEPIEAPQSEYFPFACKYMTKKLYGEDG